MKFQENQFQSWRRTALGALIPVLMLGAIALAGRATADSAGGHHPFTVDRMVSHMTTKLGLSDAQSQQVRQVLEAQQSQLQAAFAAVKSARQALRTASEAATVDEGAIRAAAQTLGQAEGDLASLHARIHAQIVPLLTADQKQKLSTLHEGHWGPHQH